MQTTAGRWRKTVIVLYRRQRRSAPRTRDWNIVEANTGPRSATDPSGAKLRWHTQRKALNASRAD
ncbi:MAG: hypothetical protein NVSMB64_03430 [Candidatus Velthaea sp.]